MDTVNIRQAIVSAKHSERQTGHLASLLHQRAPFLHKAIRLPEQNMVPTLLHFIIRYIDHVPEFLDALNGIGNSLGIEDVTDPLLAVANEFFAQPPALLNGHHGLQALMDEAYLAHRLIEEINDRFTSHSGASLVPMDMTRSNLIIHHLIGEPFANQLDEAVALIVDNLEQQDCLFVSLSSVARPGATENILWQKELERWPCLTDTLVVDLLLGSASGASGAKVIH